MQKRVQKTIANYEEAENLAVDILSFIASDAKSLSLFLDITGLSPERIREAATSHSFFIGILQFLSSNEDLLVRFCEENNYDPTSIAKALIFLSKDETGPTAEYF